MTTINISHRMPKSKPRLSPIPARWHTRSSSGREDLMMMTTTTTVGARCQRRRRYHAAGAFAAAAAFAAVCIVEWRNSRRKARSVCKLAAQREGEVSGCTEGLVGALSPLGVENTAVGRAGRGRRAEHTYSSIIHKNTPYIRSMR